MTQLFDLRSAIVTVFQQKRRVLDFSFFLQPVFAYFGEIMGKYSIILVVGFIAAVTYGLEYSKGLNGDPWNAWGGNIDSKINDETDDKDFEAKKLPVKKNNFRRMRSS